MTLCDAGHDAGLARSVTESPAAIARIFGAIVAWLLGDEDRAEQEAAGAFAREAELGMDSWATMVSLWGASTVSMLCRDAVTTLRRCDDGIALAKAGGYGLGIPYMTVNRGWAIAVLGDADRRRSAGHRGHTDGRGVRCRIHARALPRRARRGVPARRPP